jgi:hypothetical protein
LGGRLNDEDRYRVRCAVRSSMERVRNGREDCPKLGRYLSNGCGGLPEVPYSPPSKADLLLREIANNVPELGMKIAVRDYSWKWVLKLGLPDSLPLEDYLDTLDESELFSTNVHKGRKWSECEISLPVRSWERVEALRRTSNGSASVFYAFPNRGEGEGEDIVGAQSFGPLRRRSKCGRPPTGLSRRDRSQSRAPRRRHHRLHPHRPFRRRRSQSPPLQCLLRSRLRPGLGILVVFTCRKDLLADVHFGVAGHRIRPWEPEGLDAFGKDLQLHLQTRALLP